MFGVYDSLTREDQQERRKYLGKTQNNFWQALFVNIALFIRATVFNVWQETL